MTRACRWATTVAMPLALAAAAACSTHRPPEGGAAESALADATTAKDVAKVTTLLASGADPNRLVNAGGNPQSAWYLALEQIRPGKPATTEIALAMLAAGADPKVAWGTNGGRPKEGFWTTFFSGHRVGGTYDEAPLSIVMLHPDPVVVKALVAAGIDRRDAVGALVDAVGGGETEIVRALVEAGVNVNGSMQGRTPLLEAIESRNAALMTYLEEHGAKENPRR